MLFLFTTLQHIESDFYGRVGSEITRQGHEVRHVTFSRRAARVLARKGFTTYCLPDRMAALDPGTDWAAEAARIEREYAVPTFRDIYRTDFVCDHRSEEWAVERTVRHVLALEGIFDECRPDVVVPEVGNETMRTGAHLIGLAREIPVLFLFYTIFPDPLRLYLNTMHAPVVEPQEIQSLTEDERGEVERFVDEFTRRATPIREPRRRPITLARLKLLARHITVKVLHDRDNEYLRPIQWAVGDLRELARARAARLFYKPGLPARPYVYFPLHIVDDYKLKRVIPHCANQVAIVEQVARSLPHGHSLVVKEHPMSIGRNRLSLLRRLGQMRNVHLVAPTENSHDLIESSEGVVVISSTVGLEALLYDKPVLTLGEPFYAGLGVTVDLAGPVGLREGIPELLSFRPDPHRIQSFLHAAMRRCRPGAPVLVDQSDENAGALAGSLVEAGRELTEGRGSQEGELDRRRNRRRGGNPANGLYSPTDQASREASEA